MAGQTRNKNTPIGFIIILIKKHCNNHKNIQRILSFTFVKNCVKTKMTRKRENASLC